MMAEPPFAPPLKSTWLWSLVIVAFMALLLFANVTVPPLMFSMVIEPAFVVFRKFGMPKSFVILVMPEVSELTTLSVPRFLTSPRMLPAVVVCTEVDDRAEADDRAAGIGVEGREDRLAAAGELDPCRTRPRPHP